VIEPSERDFSVAWAWISNHADNGRASLAKFRAAARAEGAAGERGHPARWSVGDRIRHRESGAEDRLRERKRDNSGWWLRDCGGLCDEAAMEAWVRIRAGGEP